MMHIQSYLGGVAVDIAIFRTNGRARWGLRKDGAAMREMRGREWGFKSMVVVLGRWRSEGMDRGGIWVLCQLSREPNRPAPQGRVTDIQGRVTGTPRPGNSAPTSAAAVTRNVLQRFSPPTTTPPPTHPHHHHHHTHTLPPQSAFFPCPTPPPPAPACPASTPTSSSPPPPPSLARP